MNHHMVKPENEVFLYQLEHLSVECCSLKGVSHSPRSHPALIKLHLRVHSLVSKELWKGLLRSFPQLHVIEMPPCQNLEDGTVIEAIEEAAKINIQNLINIKSFIIRNYANSPTIELTQRSLNILKTVCPNLKEVGDKSVWNLSDNNPKTKLLL